MAIILSFVYFDNHIVLDLPCFFNIKIKNLCKHFAYINFTLTEEICIFFTKSNYLKIFSCYTFLERNDVRMTLSDAIRKRIKNLLKEKDMNV